MMTESTGIPAQSIDQIVEHLDEIVQRSRRERSRLGFFAALYRKVTVAVKDGIASGRFEDGPRMEQLDVIFANRYLAALEQFNQGQPTSRCWLVAFRSAASGRLLILQHLLLGMNAHINLDLGIAAARAAPGGKLPELKRDFDEITSLLAELMDEVQTDIGALSPALKLLDLVGGRTDEIVANFSMNKAREAAWRVAEDLAPLSLDQQEPYVAQLDRSITSLASVIRNPGLKIGIATQIIRLFEQNNVAVVLDTLA